MEKESQQNNQSPNKFKRVLRHVFFDNMWSSGVILLFFIVVVSLRPFILYDPNIVHNLDEFASALKVPILIFVLYLVFRLASSRHLKKSRQAPEQEVSSVVPSTPEKKSVFAPMLQVIILSIIGVMLGLYFYYLTIFTSSLNISLYIQLSIWYVLYSFSNFYTGLVLIILLIFAFVLWLYLLAISSVRQARRSGTAITLNQKLAILLLAFVCTYSGVLAVVFLLKWSAGYGQLRGEYTPLSPSSSQSPSENEIQNWQTYRNDKFGFEIRYPKSFVVYSDIDFSKETVVYPASDSRKITMTSTPGLLFCCEPSTLSIEILEEYVQDPETWVDTKKFITEQNSYRIEARGYEIFNGTNSYRIYSDPGLDSPNNIVIFNKGIYTFLIRYVSHSPFDQVLSTFKLAP